MKGLKKFHVWLLAQATLACFVDAFLSFYNLPNFCLREYKQVARITAPLSALNEAMEQRLQSIERSFNELTERLADPDVIDDSKLLMSLAQERASIESVVVEYGTWKMKKSELDEVKELSDSDDTEIKEMAREEARDLEAQISTLEDNLIILLIPRDPNDNKNVIVEIRAGTGGGEANLWAGDLINAYRKFAESEGWSVKLMEETQGDDGGYKNAALEIQGDGVYSKMKFEVCRIPLFSFVFCILG
jgi:peptide chain release factor 1